MAKELLRNAVEAFNEGRIEPTALELGQYQSSSIPIFRSVKSKVESGASAYSIGV